MTDEERKAWETYVDHCKIMAGNPVLYKEMSFIKPVLAADAELKRLREAIEQERIEGRRMAERALDRTVRGREWLAEYKAMKEAIGWACGILTQHAGDPYMAREVIADELRRRAMEG